MHVEIRSYVLTWATLGTLIFTSSNLKGSCKQFELILSLLKDTDTIADVLTLQDHANYRGRYALLSRITHSTRGILLFTEQVARNHLIGLQEQGFKIVVRLEIGLLDAAVIPPGNPVHTELHHSSKGGIGEKQPVLLLTSTTDTLRLLHELKHIKDDQEGVTDRLHKALKTLKSNQRRLSDHEIYRIFKGLIEQRGHAIETTNARIFIAHDYRPADILGSMQTRATRSLEEFRGIYSGGLLEILESLSRTDPELYLKVKDLFRQFAVEYEEAPEFYLKSLFPEHFE